ncbi:MAG TPA: single-stranded-DNA-specific exonuclease RecJ [Vicinamibacterales bacterium]|nr:single-stranded-DNA-specific exonuclease RecJ [Vicinamibacterales bacterium]HPW21902.1 single-stranded-DNA-specific exonuclease RecJ [Vicinamibacterales bacterium]
MARYIWEVPPLDEAAAARLARDAGLDPVLARLLVARGVTDAGQAGRFLHPSLDHLHDPFLMAGMAAATDRVLAAVAARERIAVHGDYDVDGITATVLVRRALEMLGGDVVHFVPERVRDGYGLNASAIERLHGEGVSVVVSVDCGIRGDEAARRARALGLDLVITDHHEPGERLPDAVAVVNPKRRDCAYPDKHLAGAGVALKLVQALCRRTGHDAWMPAFVKIAALGTLADAVPLLGENRVIAKLGLDALSRGPHKIGLRALIESAGLAGKAIDAYHVSFVLAPRMNAAGRMSTPDIAMRLLLATDDDMAHEARELAARLDAENARRQQEERAVFVEARRAVEKDPDVGSRHVLVVAGEGWHRGVIGIVASRLVDAFGKPAVVLAVEGDAVHGSCRSIPAFDMLAGLQACEAHLEQFGGHRAAAGLTMRREAIRAFRQAIAAWAEERLSPDDLRPRLRIDARIGFRQITPGLAQTLSALGPFGIGNPKPVFATAGVRLADGPRRLKERHLSMSLRHDGVPLRAVFWRAAERAAEIAALADGLDVAYSVQQNTFNGATSVEVSLADVRPAGGGVP